MKLTTAKKRNLNKYKLKKKNLYMTFSYKKYHLNPGAERGDRGGAAAPRPNQKKTPI